MHDPTRPLPWDQTWWGLSLLTACSLVGVAFYGLLFLLLLATLGRLLYG